MSKGLKLTILFVLSWLLVFAIILPVFANDGPCSEQLPPSQFMSDNVEYQIVIVSTMRDLQLACHNPNRLLACALNDRPVIYMIQDRFIAELAGDVHKGRRWKQCLITHEVAHLNGWRH
jgi:hypothetical protein